jgi:DNA-binding CsgD family transcriptional regulator
MSAAACDVGALGARRAAAGRRRASSTRRARGTRCAPRWRPRRWPDAWPSCWTSPACRAARPAAAAAALPDDAALRARFGLTGREATVARLLAERLSDAEIGARLGTSPHTARTHVERVRAKVGVARRSEVAARLHEP